MSDTERQPVSVGRAVELAVDHLARRPLLVVSDFDGTLSQIAMDPWAAAVLPLGRRALRRLAGMPGVHVVMLSGRTSADVAGRVRVGNVTYIGNHGLERAHLPRRGRPERLETVVTESSADAAEAAERLATQIPSRIPDDWLIVERKPPAVSFHYRAAPDVPAAAERVRAAVEELEPDGLLERVPGRRVLELRPLGATAKGETMRALIEELAPGSVFMLGDDVSDAQAFRALRESRRSGLTDGLAVGVQARAETPPEVLEAADVVLGSPRDAARFLSAVAGRLARQGPV